MAIREVRIMGDDILEKTVQTGHKDDDAHKNFDRGYAGYDV